MMLIFLHAELLPRADWDLTTQSQITLFNMHRHARRKAGFEHFSAATACCAALPCQKQPAASNVTPPVSAAWTRIGYRITGGCMYRAYLLASMRVRFCRRTTASVPPPPQRWLSACQSISRVSSLIFNYAAVFAASYTRFRFI
jgi:hypothetical protein